MPHFTVAGPPPARRQNPAIYKLSLLSLYHLKGFLKNHHKNESKHRQSIIILKRLTLIPSISQIPSGLIFFQVLTHNDMNMQNLSSHPKLCHSHSPSHSHMPFTFNREFLEIKQGKESAVMTWQPHARKGKACCGRLLKHHSRWVGVLSVFFSSYYLTYFLPVMLCASSGL